EFIPAFGAESTLEFGTGVGLGTDTIVAGVGCDNELGTCAGAAFVFLRSEVVSGNVNTGDGSPPVRVLSLNGSVGGPCGTVPVVAGAPATLSIDGAPASAGGAYAVWILDGGLAAGEAVRLRKGGVVHELGTGVRCLPSNNTVTPGSCPCPLTVPLGWTSKSL